MKCGFCKSGGGSVSTTTKTIGGKQRLVISCSSCGAILGIVDK